MKSAGAPLCLHVHSQPRAPECCPAEHPSPFAYSVCSLNSCKFLVFLSSSLPSPAGGCRRVLLPPGCGQQAAVWPWLSQPKTCTQHSFFAASVSPFPQINVFILFFFPHTGQQNTAGLGVPVAGSTLVTPAHQKWGGSASPEPCPRENADIWHFSGAMGLVAKGFLPQWLNLCQTQRCRAFGPPDVVFVL